MLKRGLYSGREGGVYSGRVAHIHLFKRGGYILRGKGIFWEGRMYLLKRGVYSGRKEVYSWRVAHNIHLLKGGIFWEGGVDSGRVAYCC